MPNNEVTPADAVAYLNELVRLDRPAMHALVESRVPCQEALADHPTVQVVSDGEDAVVGFLGVLNGLFGTDAEGWGAIAAVFDEQGDLLRFKERGS